MTPEELLQQEERVQKLKEDLKIVDNLRIEKAEIEKATAEQKKLFEFYSEKVLATKDELENLEIARIEIQNDTSGEFKARNESLNKKETELGAIETTLERRAEELTESVKQINLKADQVKIDQESLNKDRGLFELLKVDFETEKEAVKKTAIELEKLRAFIQLRDDALNLRKNNLEDRDRVITARELSIVSDAGKLDYDLAIFAKERKELDYQKERFFLDQRNVGIDFENIAISKAEILKKEEGFLAREQGIQKTEADLSKRAKALEIKDLELKVREKEVSMKEKLISLDKKLSDV